MRFTKSEKYELDPVDETIIRCLTDNARATMTDIGRKSGKSRGSVFERITAMEEAGIIKGYTVIINWDLIKEEGE